MGLSGASNDMLDENKRRIYANMGTCYNGDTNPMYAQNLMNNYDKNSSNGRMTIDITSSDGTISQYNQDQMKYILENGDAIQKQLATQITPNISQGAMN